jgi:hypothetical protein
VASISIAVAVAILTFGSGLLGLYLQKRLPQTHLSGDSKDMILLFDRIAQIPVVP